MRNEGIRTLQFNKSSIVAARELVGRVNRSMYARRYLADPVWRLGRFIMISRSC